MSNKTCEFCGKYPDELVAVTVHKNTDDEDIISVGVEEHNLVITSFEHGELERDAINYCPACGRELEW